MSKYFKIVSPFLILILFIGCTAKYYKNSADKEVYKIIGEKTKNIKGMPSTFIIDSKDDLSTATLSKKDALVLTLNQSIETAVKNSRDYQSQKEALYIQGLSLTSSRHEWDYIFSGTAEGEVGRDAKVSSASSTFGLGLSKMFATGADLSLDLTTNLMRNISSGDPEKTAASAISATLTQPLLKGAGKKVAMENLTQAERDMMYAIRDFIRYRRTFSVDIAKKYFEILKAKDRLKNALENYNGLKEDMQRDALLAEAGRKPQIQVDQTKQDELSARDNWIQAQQSYDKLLDNFKITLGLSADMQIILDENEMKRLAEKGLNKINITVDQATSRSLEYRLDLMNEKEAFEDAERKVAVAKNSLKPGLDLILQYNNQTQEALKPLKFGDEYDSYSAGLSLDSPFDKKSDRNNYRQALISYESSKRDLSKSIDDIKLEVRNALRNLDQAEKSYEIQKISLGLSEKRVDMTSLFQEAGRSATTRDVLEARRSLLNSQNALTSALIDHYNARLDLFIALESLIIDDNGIWQEGKL